MVFPVQRLISSQVKSEDEKSARLQIQTTPDSDRRLLEVICEKPGEVGEVGVFFFGGGLSCFFFFFLGGGD